ncbi:aspartate-semialdehyde dehydrogenase [Legionella steelei]|uniref:N-acetyl-gamma-glutamyl-phosphate reductase n=1 Tax=Legionella steelei TaxID=947033 RepID=A0A0W0ZI36_9GAMM|nr:N-acetyl-gamma-glutamyl-phosphate reductase [Legionella steelei]KTD68648.1 aspartate-semialdehyde dehydrogenase [Legionella steelei]
MKTHYKVAVIGRNGYVGKELINLIQKHPHLNLLNLGSIAECVQNSFELDTIFLATPTVVSIDAASKLINTDINIIDLSGAFRLPKDDFTHWYGMQHDASFLIEKACYGLCPWETLQSKSQLIANPGCYATAALMALLPLFKTNIIDKKSIIIDAKSGVSGSGKKPTPELMFCEIANNFYPYKIGIHQHIPEIEKAIRDFSEKETKITLTTSILPIVRGLAMTIYLQPASSFTPDEDISEAILNAFQIHYQSYPLIRYQEVGKGSTEDEQKLLGLQQLIHTPYCHIGFFVKEGQITLFSSIDNLLKGAASQAIENLNAMYQLPLQTGLTL